MYLCVKGSDFYYLLVYDILPRMTNDPVIFCHYRHLSFEYSPQKLLGQMNQHLVGNIYGRSSIKSDHHDPLTNMTAIGNFFVVGRSLKNRLL